MLRTQALFKQAIRSKHSLPPLAFEYNALEPFISSQIMEIHHKKHHQTYINNLNVLEEKLAEAVAKNDIVTQVSLQPAHKFNAGGHINHSIFWTNLAPKKNGGGELNNASLHDQIKKDFGSFDNFQKQFAAASVGVMGSGWGWLGYSKEGKRLEIATTSNQDPLTALVPVLGIDVWEHAYYLQYQNVRPDYLKAIFNVINWENVAERFEKASK